MGYKMNGFSGFGNSPVKHNGSPQKGIPTPDDIEHNTWHANKDHVEGGGDPNIKKVWSESKKRWVNYYQPIDPKKKEKKEKTGNPSLKEK